MKAKYLMMLGAAALMMTACDPSYEKTPVDTKIYTADQLNQMITFTQYDVNGNPAADGNYIHFETSPSQIVLISNSNGKKLAQAAAGEFELTPTPGSDPNQIVNITAVNIDGSQISTQKTLTVAVAADFDPEIKLLCSASGTKKWEWGPNEAGRVWGNAGNSGGAFDGSSIWWGCGPIGGDCADGDFSSQMNHSSTGLVEETELGAYMVFSAEGVVTKYSKDGVELGKGNFTVSNWTGGEQTDWNAGTLHVENGAILFPFMINTEGYVVTDFNISILTTDQLWLTAYDETGEHHPDGSASTPGSWSEATWWSFTSKTDYIGMLTDNGSKDWTWGPNEAGRVWGNAGNSGGTFDGSSIWWGCGPIGGDCGDGDFSSQMGHSSTGCVEETELGAYMTFKNDGTIIKYSKDGVELVRGDWTITNYSPEQTDWNGGTLSVTNGAVLFPFMINTEGYVVTDFNISGLSSGVLWLTAYDETGEHHPDGSASTPGSWSEATWWRFAAK
ncbi:MAG: hypothetical protein LIP03_01485 [Bacteroidales bacterium]|nr:hypothetical protein [Bacteroidales bacterium]